MRFLSLLALLLAISHASASSSSNDYMSTVNRAGGWGHVDVSLEAGRFEPQHIHQWGSLDVTPTGAPTVAHFTYDPYDLQAGPSTWATNFPTGQCGGNNQSPIPLPAVANTKPDSTGLLQPLTPVYGTAQPANTLSLRNTGHALQINLPTGLTLKGGALGANPYGVVQMHMHARSEHSVSGAFYPLEIHIVHQDPTRNATTDPRAYAVVGIMVQESIDGKDNAALLPLTQLLPNFTTTLNNFNTSVTLTSTFSLTDLLPTNMDYYHYNGSLTTPPCNEQVVWHVLTTPISASRAQIYALTAPFGTTGNSRPTQPLNTRSIVVTSFQTPTPTPTSQVRNSGSTLTLSFMGVLSVIAAVMNMQ